LICEKDKSDGRIKYKTKNRVRVEKPTNRYTKIEGLKQREKEGWSEDIYRTGQSEWKT